MMTHYLRIYQLSHLSSSIYQCLELTIIQNTLVYFKFYYAKKWFSSLESSLTNLIPTRNSTCLVAVERYNIIAYILATPINRRGTCWCISEPYFIGESISFSRYNLLQNLLRKVLYKSNINTQSFFNFYKKQMIIKIYLLLDNLVFNR